MLIQSARWLLLNCSSQRRPTQGAPGSILSYFLASFYHLDKRRKKVLANPRGYASFQWSGSTRQMNYVLQSISVSRQGSKFQCMCDCNCGSAFFYPGSMKLRPPDFSCNCSIHSQHVLEITRKSHAVFALSVFVITGGWRLISARLERFIGFNQLFKLQKKKTSRKGSVNPEGALRVGQSACFPLDSSYVK